jgi:addiction module HigA family antidote
VIVSFRHKGLERYCRTGSTLGIQTEHATKLARILAALDAAARLGMARVSLSRVLNGKAGISPDLAVRLERAGVSTARFRMNLQSNYELAQALDRPQPPVTPWQDGSACT